MCSLEGENYEITGGEKPFGRAESEPGWAGAGCRLPAGEPWPRRQSLVPGAWALGGPGLAAARGDRTAAPRPPGERQAPGTPAAERRLYDCCEKHTLMTIETASSPISGPQFFKNEALTALGVFGCAYSRLVPPCLPDLGQRRWPRGVSARGVDSPWWVGGYLCTVALTEFP